MRALITGANGFIGSHLAEFLADKDIDVIACINKGKKNLEHAADKVIIERCDITERGAIEDVVNRHQPDYVFHLAAQSFVVPSWNDPESTLTTNILGTFYLLDAIQRAGIMPVIEIACSASEYGLTHESEIPITEHKELRPSSPYAVSKVGTDMLAQLYARAYGMRILRLRFFNIIGPRKVMDACSDFAKRIVEVEKGKAHTLAVGNLAGIRDLTDIKDAIAAMWLLAEKGASGDVYNICSGRRYQMKDVVDTFVSLSTKRIDITEDASKFRVLDDPLFVGDNSRLRALGWEPRVPLEQTAREMLEYWREEIE